MTNGETLIVVCTLLCVLFTVFSFLLWRSTQKLSENDLNKMIELMGRIEDAANGK